MHFIQFKYGQIEPLGSSRILVFRVKHLPIVKQDYGFLNASDNERCDASCPTTEAGIVIAHKLNGLELISKREAALAK